MIIIPGQGGTYRHLRGRVTHLLAETDQTRALEYGNSGTAAGGHPSPPLSSSGILPGSKQV
jgi:hypothetical protein